jgi:hypothetical protein
MPLIERDDTLLVVIDLQPRFWGDRLDGQDRQCAVDAAARATRALPRRRDSRCDPQGPSPVSAGFDLFDHMFEY